MRNNDDRNPQESSLYERRSRHDHGASNHHHYGYESYMVDDPLEPESYNSEFKTPEKEIIPETKDKGKKLNLTPITMVRCNTIQEQNGNFIMKGLLDSGGTHTMINKKCLKQGTVITPIANAEHMTLGGNF